MPILFGRTGAITIGNCLIRIRRISFEFFGDVKPVGEGVSELRIDYGPGPRVYLVQHGDVILLCGGDKKSQDCDILSVKRWAAELEE